MPNLTSPGIPPVKKGDLFSSIGDFFGGAVNSINGFLNANPNVKHVLDGVVHVAVISGLTFVATALAPASAVAITGTGIATAVLVGVKVYAASQAEATLTGTLATVAANVPATSVLNGAPSILDTIATEAAAKASK